MKKILIIYASAGDGHKKAAEAVYREFKEISPKQEAVFIDSLNYTTRFFKFFYRRIYIVLIRYLPWLWGFFYHLLNNRFFFVIIAPFRRLTNALNSAKLVRFLLDERFDAVISTHFFAPEVISRLKEKSGLSMPLISIVTDFKAHLYWIAKNVDRYVVASESVKKDLAERGVPAEKISVLGIPVRRKFSEPVSKAAARSRLGLSPDKFTILMMGGGLGVGPIKDVLSGLQRLDFDCQIMVICGHNKGLLEELRSMAGSFVKYTRIMGFCHNIDTFMSASDIMISKVGGVTVSESLSAGLPIACIKPIPGQESANAEFLFGNGIGFRVRGRHEVNDIIRKFFHSPPFAKEIQNKIRSLARPDSAKDIVELTLNMIR